MLNFILGASILILIIFFVTYFMYCFGLFFVLKRLNARKWQAFIPVWNYHELVIALGLPKRWFLYCLLPYAGSIYSIAVAERLGKVFNKKFPFSAFWLTLGAPIGMNIIAFSKIELDLSIVQSPSPNLNAIKTKLANLKRKHN